MEMATKPVINAICFKICYIFKNNVQCKVKTRCKIRAKFLQIRWASFGFLKKQKRPQTRPYQEVHYF
ncbi:hypothetical protein N231_12365 [Geobacillus stearothermophilus ATCC 12980]|uniref:Uncharacterized protein n=1 Tax=Geobacillus stearothermophilus TaxID=1422 RepID=A0A3L7D9Z5_GEOSE|nr:hypothetical protein AA906_13280 [Geobacillus stearothermophilus]KOR92879.1 hypothetical protein N231_12365 [Geobacillus stearothermophilus ATCC 12980]KMY64397.1 hypothetical protein AA904_00545 [Geobacillus stearothermophilus]KMY65085.1 hypothetical protein AA905_00025 [Geobacillus stearothermophilus]RLP85835.1 hypothetical protein D9546_13500 [Geobacillus stearothermophilus]